MPDIKWTIIFCRGPREVQFLYSAKTRTSRGARLRDCLWDWWWKWTLLGFWHWRKGKFFFEILNTVKTAFRGHCFDVRIIMRLQKNILRSFRSTTRLNAANSSTVPNAAAIATSATRAPFYELYNKKTYERRKFEGEKSVAITESLTRNSSFFYYFWFLHFIEFWKILKKWERKIQEQKSWN